MPTDFVICGFWGRSGAVLSYRYQYPYRYHGEEAKPMGDEIRAVCEALEHLGGLKQDQPA